MTTFLFDLDGTLTDPREGITRSIAYALERMGRAPPPLDDLTFAIGPPLRRSLAQLLGNDDTAEVERTLAFYRERFADVGLFENSPYEGIVESLATLRAGRARHPMVTRFALVTTDRMCLQAPCIPCRSISSRISRRSRN